VDGDQPGEWIPLAEAAERLATTVDALRKRVRREQVRARRGNDGKVYVLVAGQEGGQGPDSGQPAARLALDLEEAREGLERWRDAAEQARERAAKAEGELAAETRRSTDLAGALEHERAERAKLAAELAEARKGWLERLLEAVRRRPR
jgi:hypothetical protein